MSHGLVNATLSLACSVVLCSSLDILDTYLAPVKAESFCARRFNSNGLSTFRSQRYSFRKKGSEIYSPIGLRYDQGHEET